jgi:hypothetical protein
VHINEGVKCSYKCRCDMCIIMGVCNLHTMRVCNVHINEGEKCVQVC